MGPPVHPPELRSLRSMKFCTPSADVPTFTHWQITGCLLSFHGAFVCVTA